jgi:hypothetical protein
MPNELFHYTSLGALIKILEGRVLWASNINYLNDGSEFTYAFHLLADMLDDFRKLQPQSKPHISMLEKALEANENTTHAIFVASFSEDGDQLGQWRAYGPPGRGVSLGIDTARLKEAAERQAFTLERCIYDRHSQNELLKVIVKEQLDFHLDRPARHKKLAQAFAERFTRIAATFKHPSFSDEREWRLISPPIGPSHKRVKYREGSSTVVPYYEFELPTDGDVLQVSTLIAGPTPLPNLSGPALTNLCFKYRLAWKNTRASLIPYRNW